MKRFSIASDHASRPNYGLTEAGLWALSRPEVVTDSNDRLMPWCDRCECWHHETAEHIEKEQS
jgi:hypothetical protein